MASGRGSAFASFPEEVHLKILDYVRKIGSPGSLLKCMQCCQQWRRIGQPVLCEDIVLTHETTIRKFFCRREKLVLRIFRDCARNLTLSESAFPDDCEYLDQIINDIQYNSQLKSLSFLLRRKFTTSWLFHILPPTIENLEINVHNIICGHSNFHLCNEIRNCLPHIKNLTLHVDHICTDLFSRNEDCLKGNTTVYSLQSIAVISWQDTCTGLRWCDSDEVDAFSFFTLYARACWLGGMFPECKGFTIISISPEDPLPWNLFLQRYDVLRNQQSIFPISWTQRFDAEDEEDYYMMKIAPKQLRYGDVYSLLRNFDHNSFAQTKHGLRIPNSLIARENYIPSNYQGEEVGDMQEFLKSHSEIKSYREVLHREIVHEKLHFENFERYHRDKRELAASLLDILRLHDNKGDQPALCGGNQYSHLTQCLHRSFF